MKRDAISLSLDLGSEQIVDNFAGGGGASTGIEMAFGRAVDVAINHDGEALAMHQANHPTTRHYREDVFDIHPGFVTGEQPIGLAWFSPDCFPAGTLILTDRGYRTIEAIREGDMVLTHAGRYRRVYATMSAHKPVYEIDIQGVPTIRVSAEHPFYARAMTNVWDNANRRYARTLGAPEWVSVRDLRVGAAPMNAAGGDRHFCGTPCTFPSLPIPAVTGRGIAVDERLMWLAGRYVGDGWSRVTAERAELVIICGKGEASALRDKLNAWPREGARSGFGEVAWHERDTATAYQFSTNHRGLVEWLRAEFGHGGGVKSFPAWALGCAESLRRALLDGYVSADGSDLRVKGFSVTETVTISRALAFSTKALVESLGHAAQVFGPRKNSREIQGRTVDAKPIYLVRWRAKLQRKQTVRDDLHNWSRVQRVSDAVAEMEVFNISVEDDETYIADGIVVHNCKHHSKAKGGKPREQKIRGLAWVTLKWATFQAPRCIALENVEEFQDWGPLDEEGRPIKSEKGRTFRAFIDALTTGLAVDHPDVQEIYETLGADFPMKRLHAGLGYKAEYRVLRACDFKVPTIRKRLYVFARRDGLPIVWPVPTHGDPKSEAVRSGRLLPWRTAAECIDWSIPCPSIFERVRPLKDATLRRIAKGIVKFVINSADPFIMSYYTADDRFRGAPLDEPLGTTTTANRFAVVAPTLMHVTHHGADRTADIGAPLATVTGAHRGEQALVTAHITKMRTGSIGSDLGEPLHTVTAGGEQARPGTGNAMGIVAATLVKQNFGDTPCQDAGAPLHTITTQGNKFGLVSATLIQTGYGEREGQEPRVPGLDKPLGTAVAGGVKHAVVSAFLAKHYGGVVGTGVDVPTGTVTTTDHHSVVTAQLVGCGGRAGQSRPRDVSEPAATITAKADTTVVTSHLLKLRNNQFGQDNREPMPTITAGGGHVGEVRALLQKYHGADALGIVTINGEQYAIVDIGMRMLTPRELARAQGFPDSYILDPMVERNRETGEIRLAQASPTSESVDNPRMIRTRKSKNARPVWVKAPLSKSAQVRMIGNSVCPPVAAAIIRANFAHENQMAGVAA